MQRNRRFLMHVLVSIRAYGAETAFKKESVKRIDHYVKISRINYDLNRWVSIRLDALGAIFTASLAAYLTYGSKASASNAGFSLNRAVMFCGELLYFIRCFNQFQVEANRYAPYHSFISVTKLIGRRL